ncbi:hypothetical protein ACIBG0_39970 [Nocardia sp. NPDC050630]|uniref:hypothetical protein n=1 Tax=Nocardia sp. NPDC050630 TaxID=3364321 RepID=UPI00378F4E2D
MLAIATASTLFVPWIGERLIDRHITAAGANISDVAQHLIMLYGCYQFGAMTFEDRPREAVYLRYWRGVAAGIAVAMIATYRLGNAYDTPAEEFELGGPVNLAHNWLIVVTIVATFALVTAAALRDIYAAGTRLRLSMFAMLALGVVGLGCSIVTGALLAIRPTYIQAEYNDFATVWTIPALAALAVAGVPGFVSAWSRRDDPRPGRPA